MVYYGKSGTPDYYANLDLQYQRGEIPLSIYSQLNNKPGWYNVELARKEIMDRYYQQKEAEEYKKKLQEEAQEQINKELPKMVDKAIADLMKGFK